MSHRIKRKFTRKIMCLGLSVALICESMIPAFGQEFLNKKSSPALSGDFFYTSNPERIMDGVIRGIDHKTEDIKTDIITYINTEHKRKLKDNAYARAEEIKNEIMPDPQEKVQREHFFPETIAKPKTNEEIKAELLEGLQTNAQTARQQVKEIYGQAVQEGADIELLPGYKEVIAEIDAELQQKTDRINNNFDEVLKELQEGAEEAFYQHVKDLFNELMSLYEQKPETIKDQVLELTPVITALVNKDKKHIYNDKQKQTLLNLYRTVLEEEVAKVGVDKSIVTNSCEIKGHCPVLLNAIMGFSVLSPSNSDGKVIFDTIEKYKDTAAYFAVLLNGISGLIVMRDYSHIRTILKNHTTEEFEFKWSYVWDKVNVMSIPQVIANAHGKYRGHRSDKGDYWSEDNKYQNIYSDIALMLAEDGTDEALKILRDYSVNKCLVYRTSGVQKETLSKYSISCRGIKPFLVGALLSGKSGAGKYSLPKPAIAKGNQYLGANGQIYNTADDHEVIGITAYENAYYDLARENFNNDPEAMLALHVMIEGMSDLNDKEEYSLDTTLYEAFKGRIPEKFLQEKHIIIDEARLSKKENRETRLGVFTVIGLVVDVYLTFTFAVGIVNIAKSAFTFGTGLLNAFKLAQIGLTVKNIPGLAKVAANYTKTAFMKTKIAAKISNMGKNFKEIVKDYKNSVRTNVLKNAAQYTNTVHTQIQGSLSALNAEYKLNKGVAGLIKGVKYEKGVFTLLDEAGEPVNLFSKITEGLGTIVKGMKYDEELGILVLGKGTEVPSQLFEVVDDIVATATTNAKIKFRIAKLFKKGVNFTEIFLKEVNSLLAASPLSVEDKEFLLEFFKGADFGTELGKFADNLASAATAARNLAENPAVVPVYEEVAGQGAQDLGVNLVINDKMPSFADNIPKYASVLKEGGRYVLKFFGKENEIIDLSAFKLKLDTKNFINLARSAGKTGNIEIKFIPKEANTFWNRNFRHVFARTKESLFGGQGTVEILTEDALGNSILTKTGITLKTYKQYDGLRLIINETKGGAIEVFKGMDALPLSTEGAFSLPKYQLGNFLKAAPRANIKMPWKIDLVGGKNKINALYLQSMVSLSVASTGLVGPLSRNYPEMDMKELSFISLIFPYLLSAATPFVSPFVKKFGAINILKTSMYLSLASLALPVMSGFHGFGGIQADNPFAKPSPKLLYPSALLIGLATTLTRGSYSPLIQAIGGGSGTLKAVAFKSISSFMLVLPPLLGAGLDQIHRKYFKNPDGTLYLDENGQTIQKHWFDFSFSYPFMLGVAGVALYRVQKAHFNRKIGRSPNAFTNTKEFFKDVGSSYALLFKKDLWPLTLSSALLAGAESSLLYTYSNSMSNEYVRNKVKIEELVPVIALIGLNAPAFITRMRSKPLLRVMGGDNMLGYRNILTSSFIFTGIGSYLLATQDDPISFAAGLTLTSIGFSQITSSILRYGHNKLELGFGKYNHLVTSWDVSYPTVYIGMSAVPYLYGYMNDKNIEGLQTKDKSDMVSLKNTSWQEVIGIPISALALGGGLAYLGMRPKNALGIMSRIGLLAPLGLFAEAHNPGFTTLVFPQPKFDQQIINQQILNQMQLKTFKPHFEYKPDLQVPALQVTPNFTLQPMSNTR